MLKILDLQNWFKDRCNSDWEHRGGISIETLDNPGWSLRINFDTLQHGIDASISRFNSTDFKEIDGFEDFVFYKFDETQNTLDVSCSVNNLEEVLAFVLKEARSSD